MKLGDRRPLYLGDVITKFHCRLMSRRDVIDMMLVFFIYAYVQKM